MSSRDNFPKPVRERLAKRAAFVCSNPACRVMTVGPGLAADEAVVYIGKAAHICAAAPGGPRFDISQSPEARAGIENAIFLCSVCADVIDANHGADHPAELLHRWKREHEDWVRGTLNRRTDERVTVVDGVHEAHGTGEVVALDIQGPAIIQPGTRSRATGHGQVTATRIGGGVRKE